MECDVYHRQDYSGFLTRTVADFLDGILLAILFLGASTVATEIAWLLHILIFLTYMIGFKLRGATPGYHIQRIRLVSMDGSPLTLPQVFVRQIAAILSGVAFSLGFLWILADRNKQAWHDKIAGTYVVRSGASPSETVVVPRRSLIRVRLFSSLVLAGAILFLGFFGGLTYLIKGSGAYELSEQYIRDNPWVRREVGSTMQFGLFPGANISTTADSGEASFAIYVSGDEGEITVTTEIEKRSGQWVILKAGYMDKDGNYFDITRPYAEERR